MAARPLLHSEPTHTLALAVIASSTAPVLLLDGQLNVVAASTSFFNAFEIEPAGAPGLPLSSLGAGEWNVPQLDSLLRATVSGNAEIEAYEMDLNRTGQRARRLVLNAHKLDYDDPAATRLLLAVCDVTDARMSEKLKDDLLREKAMLLQELQHRVANSLQIIASVLLQSARKVNSEESRAHLRDAHQRVMSVAAVQRQLADSKLGDVELRPYFTDLCHSIGASMIRDHDQLTLEVTTDDSITSSEMSVSLGLLVTELVINALKHAFPDRRHGTIRVDYRADGPAWTLSVRDDGAGMASDPARLTPGLGTTIVEALARQLGARVVITDAGPGTQVSIRHTGADDLVAVRPLVDVVNAVVASAAG